MTTKEPYLAAVPDDRKYPIGNVTFLVTDIERSSRMSARRWENDYRTTVLAPCFGLMRKVVYTHNGFAFKDTGDGLIVAFQDPEDAVACAIALQKEFAQLPQKTDLDAKAWKIAIRIGVHTTGKNLEPKPSFDEFEHPDYKDETVNVAARLADLATGGQIFVSESTCARLPSNDDVKCKRFRASLKGFPFTGLIWIADLSVRMLFEGIIA